jgi:membrane protease YdiL (CAAX protease family)
MILLNIIEAIALVVFFGIFIHLLTYVPDIPWRMAIALALVVSIWIWFYLQERKTNEQSRDVWEIVSAFAIGFWLFVFLRYLGLVQWPLAHADNLRAYLFLLVSHLVFVVTVLACLLWVAGKRISFDLLSFGNWRKDSLGHTGQIVLLAIAAGTWIWAIYFVMSVKLPVSEGLLFFMIIAFIKAILTGATEEVSYRGIIQPVAIARFGIPFGIIIQGCLYTTFHLHLGAAFCGHIGFLFVVMGLGLLFGVITRLTSGIGWACIIHIAINLVIEWQNLL